MSGFDQELQTGEAEEVKAPIEPKEELVEEVTGTYRFELSVESFGPPLPEAASYSNTFEITE